MKRKKHKVYYKPVRTSNLPFPVYKVYNDGGHFVATRVLSSAFFRKRRSRKCVSLEESFFNELYACAKQENLSKSELKQSLCALLTEKFPKLLDVESFVEEQINKKRHNFYVRLKRFRRKANLNRWTNFVTITYDDKKHTEDSFRKKLRKCFSNLHSRRDWKYMGVFERAPETGRLHFHALVYVPEGEMVGSLELRKDYSTSQHKMQETICNTFFEDTFGRNDFEPLSLTDINNGRALEYLTKYLHKTNDKIVYSRGIPSEIYKDDLTENDIATDMLDFVQKFVLFDDAIDYAKDIQHYVPTQIDMFDYFEKPKILTA